MTIKNRISIIRHFFQKNDVFCLQSQLAHLHEKHGQDALKAEQLETLNKDSQINLENLISENAALTETIEKLEYENRRLTENFDLENNNLKEKSESVSLSKPASVALLGFHFNLPMKETTTTRSTGFIKVLPGIFGVVEVTVGREIRDMCPTSLSDICPISLTLKINKMISCSFAATVTFYNKKLAAPLLTCET